MVGDHGGNAVDRTAIMEGEWGRKEGGYLGIAWYGLGGDRSFQGHPWNPILRQKREKVYKRHIWGIRRE